MSENLFGRMVSVSMVLGFLVATAAAVSIETVTAGNPGNAADSAAHSGNPAGQGSVAYTYNIGKYEVTAGQYCEFLNKVAATDTFGLYNPSMSNTSSGSGISRSGSEGSYTYGVDPAFANRPVNYVSYWDACRFSNWLSNGQPTGAQGAGTTETGAYTLNGYNGIDGQTIQRNPGSRWAVASEDEWYKAAYYNPAAGNYYDYPTSSNTVPGRDMADAAGNNANYSSALPIDSGKYTTLVGQFQNSDSSYGTFDQGGNVWEWNEAFIDLGGMSRGRGTRGGSFQSSEGSLHASDRYLGSPAAEFNDRGFRVVEVPEPASMALLALGSVGILVRRRGLGR